MVALAAPDRTPPTGTVKINNGAATTMTPTVTLTLTAKDNPGGSGMVGGKAGMQVRNTNGPWPNNGWEPFKTSKPWTLLAGTGPKTVYVKFRDKAGNTMRQPVTAAIQLVPAPPSDTTPPTGTVTINGGAATTTTLTVTLTLTAQDNPGGSSMTGGQAGMQIRNDNPATWPTTGWEPFQPSKAWTLTAGDGAKTVYVKFRDAAGNAMAAPAFATIRLETPPPPDTTPPTISNLRATDVTPTTATIRWTTNEPATSQVEYGLTTAYGSRTPRAATRITDHAVTLTDLQASTLYHVRVLSDDAAGNHAASPDLTFMTTAPPDTTPPGAPGQPTEDDPDQDYDADGSYTVAWAAVTDVESGVTAYELQEEVNGGAWTTLTSTLTATSYLVTGRTHGARYAYRARAQNGAIIWGEYSLESDGIVVNKHPPVISVVSPPDGGSYTEGDRVTITVTASDTDDDPLEYQFLVDGVVTRIWNATASWIWDTTGFPRVHRLTVQVRDPYGVQVEQSQELFGYRRARGIP